MKLSDEIINSLSINLRKKINNIKDSSANIEEIRLRVNKPMIINGDSQDYFYDNRNNCLSLNMKNPYIVTKEDIEETFQLICRYSVHSFIDDIKKGFITLRGGHRIGIVGKAIIENGQVKNIKHIYISQSMQLRQPPCVAISSILTEATGLAKILFAIDIARYSQKNIGQKLYSI